MVDLGRLNEAKWAACNRRYPAETPSMEWCAELAEEVVRAYLGMRRDEVGSPDA